MTDPIALARRHGFAEAGWAAANSPEALESYDAWIAAGRQGPLEYLARHQELRHRPHDLLDGGGVGFLVVLLAMPFSAGSSEQLPKGHGWIARYARGRDYHKVMRKRLTRLLDDLREQHPRLKGRALVDSAPVLERDLAVQAGLGWIGKHGLLLHPKLGSSLMIGSLVLSQRPQGLKDPKAMPDHCGSCRACLEACPTGCLDEERGMDADRCISTWTIEDPALPGPDRLANWGDHIFGCDLCQDPCPWNHKVRDTEAAASGRRGNHPLRFREDLESPKLDDLLATLLRDPDRLLNGSALRRTGRAGLVRNLLVVAHRQGHEFPADLVTACENEGGEVTDLLHWSRSLPKVPAT